MLKQETVQNHGPEDGRSQFCATAGVWQEAGVCEVQDHRDWQGGQGNEGGGGDQGDPGEPSHHQG